MEETDNNDADVFVYMGARGPVPPLDVVRVRAHPSVTVIPEYSGARFGFFKCQQLVLIELCEDLLEIGWGAFTSCRKLKEITIPSTVTAIHFHTFSYCEKLEGIDLCEGLQEIEQYAFYACASLKRLLIPNAVRSIGKNAFCETHFTKFRFPPQVTTVSEEVLLNCRSLFSIEISESVTRIQRAAFKGCITLRNIAIPPNAQVEEIAEEDEESEDEESEDAFDRCTDLQQLYQTDEQLVNELKHRFDNLPIHKMIYYQSYNNISVDQLNNATNMRSNQRRSLRSKLNTTGSQQDCLGMTPLHILACSTVQNIELYKVLVTKYPETLVTEDRWGAVPLLYAIWGNAPDEIIQYLVETYKSIHPNHMFNWTEMVKTLGKANVPLEEMQSILDLKQESFPEQSIDWKQVIDELTKRDGFYYAFKVSEKVFRCVVKYSMAERISALGPRKWREDMACKLEESFSFNIESDDSCPGGWYIFVSSKLSKYEKEYINLKEATAMLELTLWNNKMAENFQEVGGHSNKRATIDEIGLRKECRINCGADIVIEHVLHYLL